MPEPAFYSLGQRQQMEELEILIDANSQRLEGRNRYLDRGSASLRSNVVTLHENFQRSGRLVDEYYAMTHDSLSQPRDQMQEVAFYAKMQAAEQAHVHATNAWLHEGLRVERGVQNALNAHEEYNMDSFQTMVVVTPSHLGQENNSSSRSRPSNQGQPSSSKASSSTRRRR
ncbi:hypothetical protein ABVB69_38220 [Streptomyces sp. NPDC000349]|uniref:hypothetical protein n=1 Tax=Streptomyces sp. NPDC000349 TaxID=3154249 RepID=UPI00336A8A8E